LIDGSVALVSDVSELWKRWGRDCNDCRPGAGWECYLRAGMYIPSLDTWMKRRLISVRSRQTGRVASLLSCGRRRDVEKNTVEEELIATYLGDGMTTLCTIRWL
jgi:hypothetical protein